MAMTTVFNLASAAGSISNVLLVPGVYLFWKMWREMVAMRETLRSEIRGVKDEVYKYYVTRQEMYEALSRAKSGGD